MTFSDHLRVGFQEQQPVVLVVDDEVIIRDIAQVTLERVGYIVLTAGDGEEALLLSRQFPGMIHVVLTDHDMPKMNGSELVGHLRSERPGIRVLMMSGGCECRSSGIRFLQKPFGPQALAKAVTGALEVYQH